MCTLPGTSTCFIYGGLKWFSRSSEVRYCFWFVWESIWNTYTPPPPRPISSTAPSTKLHSKPYIRITHMTLTTAPNVSLRKTSSGHKITCLLPHASTTGTSYVSDTWLRPDNDFKAFHSVHFSYITAFIRQQNAHTQLQKKEVKWSRYRPGVTQKVGRGIALHVVQRSLHTGPIE